MKRVNILPRNFYLNEDVLALSQALLGKFLVTRFNGQVTSGMIVETEAYYGPQDKASHAFNNRRTSRTETMYAEGGVAYIFLCYGLHHLFNIVTAPKDVPHAVLIRALEPVEGIPLMLKRRAMKTVKTQLTGGPGVLTTALGITNQLNGIELTKKPVWIEDRHRFVSTQDIIASPRVGIDYAQEYKDLPWRFRLKNNPWTSKA